MKKFSKMLGVTLLEVMLVLAVAAMIIVMSVRYYQSATSNQQANAILQQIQAIAAAADQLAQSTGTYSGVNFSSIEALVPANSMTSPWGTAIGVTGAGSSYDVTIGAPPTAVCPLIVSRLDSNTHFVKPIVCDSGTGLNYTYKANP